jgi:putative transposase
MISPVIHRGSTGEMMRGFKSAHFEKEIILTCVRSYVAYPLSDRQLEEMMQERGVTVDHSITKRWVLKYAPALEAAFRQRKRPVGHSWWMDETSMKANGQWKYLYRAVDKAGHTIDFQLTEHRDDQAARRFLAQAIRCHGVPETITLDGSEANAATIRSYNDEHGTSIAIRQVKCLNNIVEQDHRSVRRGTRSMLGFKSFDAAQWTLAGIELMPMLKKGQLVREDGAEALTPAEQFYAWPRNPQLSRPYHTLAETFRQNQLSSTLYNFKM